MFDGMLAWLEVLIWLSGTIIEELIISTTDVMPIDTGARITFW